MLPILAATSQGLPPWANELLKFVLEKIVYLGFIAVIVTVLAVWFLSALSIMMSNSICRIDKNDISKCLSTSLFWAVLGTGLGVLLPFSGISESLIGLINLIAAPLMLGLLIKVVFHAKLLRSLAAGLLAYVLSIIISLASIFGTIVAISTFTRMYAAR